jgi:Xaa-Pro aminopeptidase
MPEATSEEFKKRRNQLCEHIGDAHALVMGGPAPNDHAPFRQYNDFYYLCGVTSPQTYLLIDGATGFTTLFLPSADDKSRERDDVVFTSDQAEEARQATGVDAVRDRHDMTTALQSVSELYTLQRDGEGLKSDFRSITDAQRQVEIDPWDGRLNRGKHFVERFRELCPQARINDLTPILLEMRMIKSPSEIDLLRRAGQLAAKGLCETMRATRPGVMEYELAAVLQYTYLAGGALDNGYAPIVAGGKNVFYAHYSSNDCALVDGDLLLLDCAPDYQHYTSDITRMWPVNGTYTSAQRAIYGFLTEYHKCLLSAIRAGRTCDEIEDEVEERMRARLGEFDFANADHAAGAEWTLKFFNHLAHSVGLSVHDGVTHKTGILEPGMVFAVDPQMRINSERLYLRVEDTGLVTETGFEVFTKDAPLELDDIEKLVTGEGILQAFPPLISNS